MTSTAQVDLTFKTTVKVQVIFTLETYHEGPEGKEMFTSTLFLTSALDWVGGQRQAPVALTAGKKPGTHFTGRQTWP